MEVETCLDCGQPVSSVWHADDGLWALVTDHPGDGLTLCTGCFDKRAEAKGYLLVWKPELHAATPR